MEWILSLNSSNSSLWPVCSLHILNPTAEGTYHHGHYFPTPRSAVTEAPADGFPKLLLDQLLSLPSRICSCGPVLVQTNAFSGQCGVRVESMEEANQATNQPTSQPASQPNAIKSGPN